MLCTLLTVTVIIVYAICDFNYVIRTLFTIWSGRLYQKSTSLTETTVIYGICTFQDCDVWFKSIRLARLARELDFARYHFYDRTSIYRRSRELDIKSLQGCTLSSTIEDIPLFVPYKITTKLVFWDDRSLFLEHEVVTLHDNKSRYFLLSRQYALGVNRHSMESLLQYLPGAECRPPCPAYVQCWLKSMEISSRKLRELNVSVK